MTRWTLISQVSSQSDERTRRDAISELCQIYWPPIYAFLRSKGNSKADAEDLTQGFFENFLKQESFENADREKGKLRTYLLRAVSNYTHSVHRNRSVQKRGGGEAVLSLDATDHEGNTILREPKEAETPESAFQKQWVVSLLNRVFEELKIRYSKRGKEDQFEALSFVISPQFDTNRYSAVASELGCSEGAVKVAAFRLKERYQKLLRETVADTLIVGEDIDNEIRELMSVFDQ